MKFSFKVLFALIFTGALTSFTACQSGNKSSKDQSETIADENITQNSHVDTVVIYQMEFKPAQLNVKKGDAVVWINKDIVGHNVTEEPGDKILSDTLQTGASFRLVPDHSFNYICSIHPTMKAAITVNQ